MAVHAGNALLQASVFEHIASSTVGVPFARIVCGMGELVRFIGVEGVVSGQAADLTLKGQSEVSLEHL